MQTDFLTASPLFQGLSPQEAIQAVRCFNGFEKSYQKGQTILSAGAPATHMGVILQGRVQVQQWDAWGSQQILEQMGPGQVFAEAYALLPNQGMTVSVAAVEASQILFLNGQRLSQPCSQGCAFHRRITQNLLCALAAKNISLTRKISHITKKTIRERLVSYLSYQAAAQGKKDFFIPFNRQGLADYLSVDRSALSAELSRMQKDGLLTFCKNHFILHEGPGRP